MLSITNRRREGITDANPLPPGVHPLNPQPLPPLILPPALTFV